MGDTMVLLASESEPYKCCKADSGALKFQVKSRAGIATLTLISKNKPCKYLFKIQLSVSSQITDLTNGQVKTADTPEVDLADFKEFWLTWFQNQIRVGLGNDFHPLLTYVAEDRTLIVGYVKFDTRSNEAPRSSPVDWKVEVTPLLKTPSRVICGGEPVWRPLHSGEPLPPDAFVGGMESGEPTYVARAPHEGSITPGKYLRSKNAAFLGWSWVEHRKEEFEILCGFNMMWVPGIYGAPPPPGALVAGVSQNENRDQLFSVRVRHLGDLVLGKQHDSFGDCYIPYDGNELQIFSDFEVLVVPAGPPNAIEMI